VAEIGINCFSLGYVVDPCDWFAEAHQDDGPIGRHDFVPISHDRFNHMPDLASGKLLSRVLYGADYRIARMVSAQAKRLEKRLSG